MQIHNLARTTPSRVGRRIGRGGKRGTTSGRGTKGQKARAGAKFFPAEREFIKKIPKLRGYRFKSFRAQPVVVNLHTLEERFDEGDTVSPATLLKARIIRRSHGKMPEVKILGRGELKKKLVFKDVLFSASAVAALGISKAD